MSKVFTKICPTCGIEFKTTNEWQTFCRKTCSNRGGASKGKDFDSSLKWERSSEDGKWLCPYTFGVACSGRRCSKCGWNPEVAEARTKKILESYGCV